MLVPLITFSNRSQFSRSFRNSFWSNSGIYFLRNLLVPTKFYIGSAVQLRNRLASHFFPETSTKFNKFCMVLEPLNSEMQC